MLTRANALGWALYEALTSAQMNVIDSQLPSAIDGDAGGDYDPTEWIQLLGVNNRGIKWMGTTWPTLEVREQTFYRPLVLVAMSAWGGSVQPWVLGGSTADWRAATGGTFYGGDIEQNYVNAVNVPYVFIDLGPAPDGCSAKAVGAVVYQPTANAGAIGTPPVVTAFKKSQSTQGAPTNPAGYAAATASATYNQANTTLESTFTPANLTGSKLYAQIQGEAGANSQTGMRIFSVYFKANVSEVRY